jgi:hypothetical protein
MSIRSVNRQINKALKDNVLTQCEAETIVQNAEKGRLTTGETKAIADLYTEGQWYMPNHFPHGAFPQPRPPQYEMKAGAEQTLLNFFVANKIPQGEGYKTAKTEIEFALKDFDYSCELPEAPNTKHLHHVHLRDQRPVDGNRTDAYVNTEKQEFYLKVTGAGMAGPDTVGPYWYGPIKMNEVAETDVVKDKISAYDLARELGLNTTRTHTPRVTDVVKNDDGTFTATVAAINWRDPSDVRDTKQAIVDAEGIFLRAVDGGSDADEVKNKIDVWAAAQAVGLHHNRSYTPRITSVTEREDGLYDVHMEAAHFMSPDDVTDSKRFVVEQSGELRLDFSPSVTDETRAKMMDALAEAKAGTHSFNHGGLPMGVRYERVELEREPGFDTYTYTALVPAGALYPGANAKDPNEASHIFIERSGGFAGWTQFAGPIDLE